MYRRSKHLSSEERGVIFVEHNRGSSQRSIGQLLHQPASTNWRGVGAGSTEIRHLLSARSAACLWCPPQAQACRGGSLLLRPWQACASAPAAWADCALSTAPRASRCDWCQAIGLTLNAGIQLPANRRMTPSRAGSIARRRARWLNARRALVVCARSTELERRRFSTASHGR